MNTESNVHVLDTQTDKQRADDLKVRASALLSQLCGLLDEAKQAGLVLGFQFTTDQYNRSAFTNLSVVKPL